MLDPKDELILNTLKNDASLSTYKISKKTSIPQTTVLNRIKKLKQEGIIKKYTVEIDYKKINKGVKALVYGKIDKNTEKKVFGKAGSIESVLSMSPYVLNVKRLMGEFDFAIEVVCKDIDELNDFLFKKVRYLDVVKETQTIVVLNEWNK